MRDPADPDPAQITALLRLARAGDLTAEADLLARLYEDLHRIARAQIGRERSAHTLQATALVHEAYLRIFGGAAPEFQDGGHFLAAAATAMRRVLVDHARQRAAQRRGGELRRDPLDETLADVGRNGVDVVAVHEALELLGRQDEELVRIVEMHFFAGLTLREVGEALGLAERTVYARWSLARAWLRGKLG